MARVNAGSGISTVREDIFEDVPVGDAILPSDNIDIMQAPFPGSDAPAPFDNAEFTPNIDGLSDNLQTGLSAQLDRGSLGHDVAADTEASEFFTPMNGGINNAFSGLEMGDVADSANAVPAMAYSELTRAGADGDTITLSEATPTSGGTVSSYSAHGDNYIDSHYYSQKWGGSLGTGASLTFSFGTSSSVYLSGYPNGEPTDSFGEFSAHQKAATRTALDYYSKVTDLTFTEVTDSSSVAGDLRFAKSGAPSTAWAYMPSSHTSGGDVWIGPSSYYNDMSEGTYGFQTLLHEIGHALGLSHPHDGIVGTAANDWVGVSLMSYKSFDGAANGYRQDYYPTTPMYNDIAALQYVYGADTTATAGNDTYSWTTGQNLYETIWDSGGTDTIDWSNQSGAANINLNAGEWSELGPQYRIDYTVSPWVYSSQTLMIAENAVIENATGGSGADTLTGNAVANALIGGAGNDTLSGGAGGDTLTGGTGNDSLTGGAGDDTFSFGSGFGFDVIYDFTAGAGTDDQIDLSLFGITNFSTLLGSISDVAGNAVITIGSDTITLDGVLSSQLNSEDFVGVSGGGTSGADTLAGTTGNDIIAGLGGADTLTGLAGNDFLYGGDGNDSLDGGAGSDNLYGGAGDDTYVIDDVGDRVFENVGEGTDTVQSGVDHRMQVNFENLTLTGSTAVQGIGNTLANVIAGNSADNILLGRAGDDTLSGSTGNDELYGNEGADTLNGDGGDDRLDGNDGDDIINGGSGADRLNGQDGNDILNGGGGIDILVGHAGADALNGGSENDWLFGGADADTLDGSLGNDMLYGGTGNDSLNGGAGSDNMFGGAGDDTYVIDNVGDRIYEKAAEGTDTVQSSLNHSMQVNFENLTLTGSTATLGIGNTLANTITGNSADNILLGRAGNDIMSGGAGDDQLYGNEDDDTLNGDGGNDRLDGNTGNDTLNGGDGADSLNGQDGNDILNGDAGADILVGHAGDDTLNGGADSDKLFGGADNDVLDGGAGNDVLYGGTGNDTLDGGAGADLMKGEAGNDTYVIDDSGDRIVENAAEGTDTVQSSLNHILQDNFENLTLTGGVATSGIGNAVANTITGNSADNILLGRAGNDIMSGGTGNDELYGNEDDDTLNGEAGNDRLDGNTGNDTLNGGDGADNLNGQDGNDILNGDAGADILVGHAGADTLNGGGDNDKLFGGADADALDGGTGDDVLYGGSGDDTLTGGDGADRLIGEAGSDQFIYGAMSEAGDTIVDFEVGASGDSVNLSALLTGLGYGGVDAVGDGYVQSLQSGSHTLIQIDSNGGGDNFTTLATLQNITETDLTTENWIL